MKPITAVFAGTVLFITIVTAPGMAAPVRSHGGAASGGQHAAAEAPLRAQVRPVIGKAPALLRIDAMIEPAELNRAVDFTVESDGYYRSSTIELEGAQAPRSHRVEFQSLPDGRYDVKVALKDARGSVRTELSLQVMVLP